MSSVLHVVMYHYIRDLPNTAFPRIKGMLISDFRRQLAILRENYEMATLESALDFLQGMYTPPRDLCLLTFDDGLKEHYADVTAMLVDHGIQGIFFLITSCLQEHRVASAHMNHFLIAALDFEFYRQAFLRRLDEMAPHIQALSKVEHTIAQRTYRWDPLEVAQFKYLFNFVLDSNVRDQIVKALFEEHIGDEKSFSCKLYVDWKEARQMQASGMLIGGHSHQHRSLATLSERALHWDLNTCHQLLREHLKPQTFWPFSYPYGTKDSFSEATVSELKELGFTCSFSTETGSNPPGEDLFALHRTDCNDAAT